MRDRGLARPQCRLIMPVGAHSVGDRNTTIGIAIAHGVGSYKPR